MTMIERVARAICAADGDSDPDEFGHNVRGEETYGWQMWVDEAKAAIKAMREPTDEVKAAVYDDPDDFPLMTWELAIDAALKEGSNT